MHIFYNTVLDMAKYYLLQWLCEPRQGHVRCSTEISTLVIVVDSTMQRYGKTFYEQ